MTVISEWSLPVPISTHEPLIIFSLSCPDEEGRDRVAFGGTWCPAMVNPMTLPSDNPAPGSHHSSGMINIIYRHPFYLPKPVCGEHKITDRENVDRGISSSQLYLPTLPLNQWRKCLVLVPRYSFQIIIFFLQRDSLLHLIWIVFDPQYPS